MKALDIISQYIAMYLNNCSIFSHGGQKELLNPKGSSPPYFSPIDI